MATNKIKPTMPVAPHVEGQPAPAAPEAAAAASLAAETASAAAAAAEAVADGEAVTGDKSSSETGTDGPAGAATDGPAGAGTDGPAGAGTAAGDPNAAGAGSGTAAAPPEVPVTTAPVVTVTAGPPVAVHESLDLPVASTDPASTGALQTIVPATATAFPPAPGHAPAVATPAAPAVAQAPAVVSPSPTAKPVPPAVTPPSVTVPPAITVASVPAATIPAAAPDEGREWVQEAVQESVPEVVPEVASEATWAPAPAKAPSPRRQREDGPEPAAALTSDRLLHKVAAPPVDGWRRFLYEVTFGAVNVGDSDKVRLDRAQDYLIASRLGHHTRYVPVLSRKGGVGKTTVTTLLGMVLADIREDRVIALDANPDRGTLSDRSPGSADFTARNLVRDRFGVTTFSQLSDYVARDGSRLDVLASDTDPAVAQAFDDSDYRAVTDILGKYYSIVLTDSGTGMVHSVMKGTLEKADAVVLVSGGSVDEARLASETLSWLEAHGRSDLVANAIVVINMSGGETQVDINQIEEHFKSRVSNVLRIPYDKHLAEGSRVELDKLRPATKTAVKSLAALVVAELQKG